MAGKWKRSGPQRYENETHYIVGQAANWDGSVASRVNRWLLYKKGNEVAVYPEGLHLSAVYPTLARAKEAVR